MKIAETLKTDSINKNVLLVITLISLGLAAWMMASRNETLHQLRTLETAQDGAQLRIKELTDKLTEKDLEVEKVAKLSAEEAVKKIINLPELDKILGIKSTTAAVDSSTTPVNSSTDQASSPSSQMSSAPTESSSVNEPNSSSATISENKSEDVSSIAVPTSDLTSSITSSTPDTSSAASTSPVSEAPSASSQQNFSPEPLTGGSASSPEVPNTP